MSDEWLPAAIGQNKEVAVSKEVADFIQRNPVFQNRPNVAIYVIIRIPLYCRNFHRKQASHMLSSIRYLLMR